jgi:hypothetical protein
MPGYDLEKATAMMADHYHIPEAGQSEQEFKDEEISKDVGLTLQDWALSVPLLVDSGAMSMDAIAGWSIQAQVEGWLKDLEAMKVAESVVADVEEAAPSALPPENAPSEMAPTTAGPDEDSPITITLQLTKNQLAQIIATSQEENGK